MKRKIFSMTLVLALVISLVPASFATGSDGKTVNLSKIDFESVTNPEKLTPENWASILGDATLSGGSIAKYQEEENAEKVYFKVVDDPISGGTNGKVLKIYNELEAADNISLDIPFERAYSADDGKILCWEMDYYFTGSVNSAGNTVVPAQYLGWTTGNFLIQRNSANTLRFKVNDVIKGNTMTPKPDVWTHLKVMFDVANDNIMLVSLDDGKNVVTQENIEATNLSDGFTKLNINLTTNPDKVDYYIDNLEFYTIDPIAIKSSVPEDGATNVLVEKNVEINLTSAIADEEELVVSVETQNGIVSESEYSYLLSEDKKKITFSFNSGLAYGSDYTIALSGAKDAYGLTLNDSISFSTEPAPDVLINKSAWIDGNIDALSFAGGKSAAINLTNTTSEEKNLLLVFAVYSNAEPSRLLSTQYVTLTLGGNETMEIIQGVKPVSNAGIAKVFVWNRFEALNPWGAPSSSVIR